MSTGPGTIQTRADCDRALSRILQATLRSEALTAERDKKIADIQKEYSPRLAKAALTISTTEAELQTFYTTHRQELETDDKKSVQFEHGVLGMRAPTNPGLVELNSKWTWEKIAAAVKAAWKSKYFHKPKPPGLDKVKLKKELTPEQLRECGMKLDTEERFFYELNRLAAPDEAAVADDAA